MKNVDLLCRIAIAVKDVPECNVQRGMHFARGASLPCCLIATTARLGIVDADHAIEHGLAWEWGAPYWGVTTMEWYDVVYLPGLLGNTAQAVSKAKCTGQDYYNAIVDLLERHGEIDVLRGMEA